MEGPGIFEAVAIKPDGTKRKVTSKGVMFQGKRTGLWAYFPARVPAQKEGATVGAFRTDKNVTPTYIGDILPDTPQGKLIDKLRSLGEALGDTPSISASEVMKDITKWQTSASWSLAMLNVSEQSGSGVGPLPAVSSSVEGIRTEWHFLGRGHSNSTYLTDKCDLLDAGLKKELPPQLVLVSPSTTDLSSRATVDALIEPAIRRFREKCNISEVKKRTLSAQPTKVHAQFGSDGKSRKLKPDRVRR